MTFAGSYRNFLGYIRRSRWQTKVQGHRRKCF